MKQRLTKLPGKGGPAGVTRARQSAHAPLEGRSLDARRRWIWVALLGVGTLGVLTWVMALLVHRRDQFHAVPEPPVAFSTNSTAPNPTPGPGRVKTDAFADTINEANKLLAQNKAAEALELLIQARQSNPEDEDVHYNLGIALAKLGRDEEARHEYAEALRIFPDYAEAQNNLGNLLLRMGSRNEAILRFQQAVKTTPDYAIAWNNLGNALQQGGQSNQARECFEKAVKLETNYWQAHFNLGTRYLQEKRFPEAKSEFQTVLRLQPGFPQAEDALRRIPSESLPGPVRSE